MSWNSQGEWGNQWPQQQQQQQQQWGQGGQQQQWAQGNQQGWGQQGQGWGNAGQAQIGIKLPTTGSPAQQMQAQQMQAAQAAQAQGPQTLIVSTGGRGMDEVVIQTLIGEYVEQGSNHERKVYKKSINAAGNQVEVFIYYWDARDGEAFSGWWFGNQLGGTQVWSHVKSTSEQPPTSGWKIPWDGAVRQELSVQLKPNAAIAAKVGAVGQVTGFMQEFSQLDSTAHAALEQAKALAADFSSIEGMKQAEELLAPQVPILTAANKKVFESQKGASGDMAKTLQMTSQKLRATQALISAELGKVRMQKFKAEKVTKAKEMHEKDRAAVQEFLPEAIQKTNAAEDAVDKTAIIAEMITSGGDDMDEIRKAVDDTEKLAKEAQTLVGEARIFLNTKMALAKRFESEVVQKEALEELTKLQAQLQASQSKLTPLKTARQDFIQRTAAEKLSNELIAKLTPAEVDVDKAEEVSAVLFSEEEPSKEAVSQADAAVSKAFDHINATVSFIETKKRSMPAQGLVRDELVKFEERVNVSLNKLNEIRAKQRGIQEKISSASIMEEAAGKLQAVQETVQKAADAEGPFLMGLEELPLEDTWTAVKACETAATSANTSVSIARMFIATKLVELKRFSTDSSKVAYAKVSDFQKQLEALTKRLTDLKKSTAERRTAAVGRESEVFVTKAEELAKAVGESASCFEDDAKLTELSADDIKNASMETGKAETAASEAISSAKKFITERQIEAKGNENSEGVSTLLIKYQTRLSTAQNEVNKYKRLAASVDQRLATKKAIEDATGKVVEVEESVKKVCDLNAELEDATPEGIGAKAHAELVQQADAAAKEAGGVLKQLDGHLQSYCRVSRSAGDEIRKLDPRIKDAQKKMEECSTKMRERADKLVVPTIIEESEKRVKEAEEACAQAMEAEVPFLGMKELSAEEAAKAFAALEAAAQRAQGMTGGAKTFLAMKRLSAKRLEESSARAALEGLSKLQVRLDESSKKFVGIKKVIQERKAEQAKREILEKVIAVEKQVDTTTEAAKELESIVASGNSSAENAKTHCEKLASLEKEGQQMAETALAFLEQKQKDSKDLGDECDKLKERIATAQAELAKSKKALSDSEQRFVAQKLLVEAASMVTNCEGEVTKVTKACAPLIEDGGSSFLDAATVTTIAEALTEQMRKSNTSREELFKEAGAVDGGNISKESFLAFLQKLPARLGKDDLALDEEERNGVFACIDADKDGQISVADFDGMFSIRYRCVQAISITDGFEISKSKSVCKLELDDVVEVIGEAQVLPNGVTRIQCKKVDSGKSGWVTSKGNQGTVYLELSSPYTAYVRATERQMDSARKMLNKTASFVKKKVSALASSSQGPLADARNELEKLKPRTDAVEQDLQALKIKFTDGQNQFSRKSAASVMRGVKAKVELMSDNAQKLEEITKPLLEASGAELEEVKTPLTISAEASKACASLTKECAAAREGIAAHREAGSKSSQGPLREIRQELAKYLEKVDAAEQKIGTTTEGIRKACASLASARVAQVSSALRSTLQKNDLNVEAFFDKYASGQSHMSGEAFLRCIGSLEGLDFPEEHTKLLVEHIGASSGIGRCGFERLVLQFFMCQKTVAITDEFAINKSKTVRMLDAGEIVEMVEGPTSDEKLGVERVKGRAVRDGVVGWISSKGNHGTPYLEEAHRPCYECVTDLALSKDATGDAPVRTLKAGEVVEVLEGPRTEEFSKGAHRGKGRACKDDKVGWFEMTSKDGASKVNRSGKFYMCTASIAMTDGRDMKKCKVLRKLAAKEVVAVLEDPTEEGGVQRVHCKALKDQLEGWITIKGNKGTVFAEETTSICTIVGDTPLHEHFESDRGAAVRTLEKDEFIELIEGPIEEKFDLTIFKGRALSDGALGWVSVKADNVMLWSARYRSLAETELRSSVKLDSDVLCTASKAEIFEALDGPREEAGCWRIQVRREKDGSVGWVMLRTAEGSAVLEHMPSPAS